MAARAGVAYIDVQGDWSAFNRSVAQRGGQLNRDFSKLGRGLGNQLTRGLSFGVKAGAVGAAASLVYVVKKAADFESQMSSLGAVTSATGKQMDQMRRQAIKAGADTKFSALEAAQAQTELAKGGLAVSQIAKGGLRSALALAAAGELDLADAAATTVNAMKLFGLHGKESMKVADGLATAANATTADVSDYAMALKQGGSAAKAAGLDFTETTAALEALATVGIKGSDAGTSLKAALTQLASPTEKSANLMEDLGLKFFDAQGNMKPLVEISGMLRDKMGGLTREQRLQATTTLVGTDGMRALLALYDAGPKKISSFEKGLNKQGTAADVARKKQDNLKGSLEQLGGSVETFAITVGTGMLPTIRKGSDELTKLTNKISGIFGRKDLTSGEKLQKAFDLTKVEIKSSPLVHKLEAAIKHADIPGHLGLAVSAAVPKIAEAVAKAAPVAVESFAHAFTSSSTWGKLAIGAVALKKFGGFGAISGRLGGNRGSTPASPVFVKDIAAGLGRGPGGVGPVPTGIGGKVKGLAKGAGKLGGELAAVDFAINLVDMHGNPIAAGINSVHDLTFGITPKVHADPARGLKVRNDFAKNSPLPKDPKVHFDAKGFPISDDQYQAQQAARNAAARRSATLQAGAFASAWIEGLKKNHEPTKTQIAGMIKVLDDLKPGARKVAAESIIGMAGAMEANGKLPKGAARGIRKAIVGHFESMKVSSVHKATDMVLGVGSTMNALVSVVTSGLALMSGNVSEALKIFGVKLPKLSLKHPQRAAKEAGKGAGALVGAAGALLGAQRGGPIRGGKPTGDSIPAVLERGEYVLNRKAVQKIGRGALDRVNFGHAPRFRQGGMVHIPGDPPGPYGDSVNSSVASLASLIVKMFRANITAAFDPGGRHKSPGHNVTGTAIDIVPNTRGNWGLIGRAVQWATNRGMTVYYDGSHGSTALANHGPGNHAHIELATGRGGALAAMPHIDKLKVLGPNSPITQLGQRALDITRHAAVSKLQKLISSSGGGSEGDEGDLGGVSGSGAGLMKQIAGRRGWSFGDWWEIDRRETGHGQNLSNPTSTARLRGQFLRQNWGKYGPGSDPSGHPSMAQQIESMAAYIAQRYGNPTKALAHHNAHNWYQRGGLVAQLAAGGGIGLGKALGKIRTGRTAKIRGQAIKALTDKVKGIGLPKDVQANLTKLATDANSFGDYADRASQLTLDPGDGSAPVPGRVNGHTQLEWLTDQLGALFKWRNAIIDAEQIVVQKRREVADLITKARARAYQIKTQMMEAAAVRKQLAKRLARVGSRIEREQKKPARHRNRTLIAGLTEQRAEIGSNIRGIDGEQRTRQRVRDALSGKIIPALGDQRKSLNTARGDLLTNLETVQGIGSPMERLARLPDVGVLGGQIFDVQMRLRDLNAQPKITDSSQADTARADLLQTLLDQANLRTRVSERQFDVFKNMPPYGGSFATGGTVPGPLGAPRTIVAHGGETVTPLDGAGGGVGVRVILEDNRTRVLVDDVEQAVEVVTRRQARAGARLLPGRGGGGLT